MVQRNSLFPEIVLEYYVHFSENKYIFSCILNTYLHLNIPQRRQYKDLQKSEDCLRQYQNVHYGVPLLFQECLYFQTFRINSAKSSPAREGSLSVISAPSLKILLHTACTSSVETSSFINGEVKSFHSISAVPP